MLVRLIYPEESKGIFKQIPGFEQNEEAKIGKITFTTDETEEADLAVVINFSPKDLRMRAKEVWIFHQKAGSYRYFGHWQKAYPYADRIFGSWQKKKNERYKDALNNLVKTQSSALWGCKQGYGFYKDLTVPEKTITISVITSTKEQKKQYKFGRKQRLEFLHGLKHELKKEGINLEIKSKVESKDDILARSKYTVVVEDVSEPHYFSEKLTDALLCETMPIYFGAPNIFEYFPKNSLILLEDLDIEKAKGIIKYTVEHNLYEKNLDAVKGAKNMVLNKYNLFMTIVEKISEYDILNKPMKDIFIPKRKKSRHPVVSDIQNKIKGIE